MFNKRLSRRSLLKWAATAAVLPIIQACAPAAPPTPTTAPAPAAVAPTPTAAPKPAAAAPTTAPAKPAASAERVKVRFNTWIGVLEPMVKKFNEMNDKIEVVFELTPFANIADKQLIDLASGIAADMLQVAGPWWPPFMRKKVLLPIDDGLKQRNVDLSKFAFSPAKACTFEGKLWGIPRLPAGRGLAYNNRLLDQAGVKYPTNEWTWDDLTAALPKVHKPPESYGMPAMTNLSILEEMIWSNNGKIVADDWSKSLLDQPAALEAVQLVVDWLLKHKVTMAPGDEKALGDNVFASDKVAFFVHVIGDWASFKTNTKNLQMPAWMTNWPYAPKTKKRVNSAEVHVYGLNPKSKVLDQAWVFYVWQTTDDEAMKIEWTLFPGNYEASKYLAALTDQKQKDFLTLRVEAAKIAESTNWGTNTSEAQKAFRSEFDLALLGKKSVPDAMKDATKAIDVILKG